LDYPSVETDSWKTTNDDSQFYNTKE